jgi:drug/metabolite transporter (DMT)-like permease
MAEQLPVIIPLVVAMLYAVAALILKRANGDLPEPWRLTFVVNWLMAAVFSVFLLRGGSAFTWLHLLHAATAGLTFFIGQIFTFLALSRGDVSVATPVLGTKVIFVALFGIAVGTEQVSAGMWLAAFITSIATALLGSSGGGKRTHPLGRSIFYGLTAAGSFALTDICMQAWGPAWGLGYFAPATFACMAVYSFALIPFFAGPLRELEWRWLLPGGTLLGFQASGIAYSIIMFRSATTTNIIYNSRGIWSVVLVWAIGHWFGNTERAHGPRIMIRRLAASLLLLSAIVLVTRR